ncbi:MAG: glycosyltransferase [Myxococcota bacterium]
MQRLRRAVYISYDGMEDPLGQSQVLPYLRKLADRGHRFELISFEKTAPTRFREKIYPGVRWTALRYHKDPTVPATAFDMAQGALTSMMTALVRRADLVHVRSYVAGTLALPLVRLARRPFLFDMRGLWADERVEDGVWSKEGRVYRGAKLVERQLVARADAITVLTNSMARYLRDESAFKDVIRAGIRVIPTCTDLDRFNVTVAPDPELQAQLQGSRVLVYVGSFGGRYLAEDMARLYLKWRGHVSSSRFLVVSRQTPTQIRDVLAEAGCADEIVHRSARYEQVASFVRCGHAGVFFHPPTFTNRGAAPTKSGEMLACGLPLAGNLVGDVPDVLERSKVGVALRTFDDDALEAAAASLARLSKLPDIAQRARQTAERWFSLDRAIDGYDQIYQTVSVGAAGGRVDDRRWPASASAQQVANA